MSGQLCFSFDERYCSGCGTCQIACKDKHDLGPGEFFRRVTEYEEGGYELRDGAVIAHVRAGWRSVSCCHCQSPACVPACPVGAITKRAQDGIVLISADRCIGCRRCERVCPNKAITFLSTVKKAAKCDFCRDLLAKGMEPACVASCPMRALHVLRLKDDEGSARH